jgi:predicted CoA-substrate-specific enzyme activase
VAASLVEMTYPAGDGNEIDIRNVHYSFHNGDLEGTLRSLLDRIPCAEVNGIAVTSSSSGLLRGAKRFDSRLACIAAAKHFHPDVGSILTVGAQQFGLITFDTEGNYRNLKTNTSCAAGTGSFLDQQAMRLNLSNSAELSEMAMRSRGKGTPPVIASRCSVFARTDIVHAQQTGYTKEEICDGICAGLADNVADILFNDGDVLGPVVFSGGVARNRAVVDHLGERLGQSLIVDDLAHVYDAVGACLLFLESGEVVPGKWEPFSSWDDVLVPGGDNDNKELYFEPLSLTLSQYPEFESDESYLYHSRHTGPDNPVEVDIYIPLAEIKNCAVYLGVDIGSTSTKAVLMGVGEEKEVVAGLYTRTAGNPIIAVQAVLEAVEDISLKKGTEFTVMGAGTTGSGRKFAGKIFGADIVPDEITAHARAAFQLNPDIDTIIEIGGQDAKFTTLRNGRVTFSRMNTVCAAGTGSFIEEQAVKLDVPLNEFSSRAEGVRAPLVSDRCTVFMERDINRFLNKNLSVNEMLAAALFAVRENYLQKVAEEGDIGGHICFQGATAKNRALVAAFEQKLQRPVFVSKYCHLTGALGTALILAEELDRPTSFKGIAVHKENIPVRTEICKLCTNRCRIRIASLKQEEVAYGFLCGRDYDTQCYVDKNTSGFDLLKAYSRVFRLPQSGAAVNSSSGPGENPCSTFTIGIPAALHLLEDLPFWKYFFNQLSIPVKSSETFPGSVKLGKKIAGAEFCSPMNAIYGHARYLSDKTDCLFLPVYLEEWRDCGKRDKERVRKYCYYTQFSASLVSRLEQVERGIKVVFPLMGYRQNSILAKLELFNSLNDVLPQKIPFLKISRAYDNAASFFRESKQRLQELFLEAEALNNRDALRVVLVGRPYTVLSAAMNKGIPGIFAALGVRAYFQDMLPDSEEIQEQISLLLDAMHWKFASRILEAAAYCAKTEGLYPVFITSFRCSPDSLTIEYFKRIMEVGDKPYLILQLDEHDSNVGYETRIEAGVRSFRNHLSTAAADRSPEPGKPAAKKHHLPVNPRLAKDFSGKILLFPNWDVITGPLLTANLRRGGIDARLLLENETVISESMRMNTGQCIPLNAVALEFIHYIEEHNLDPADTVLWMLNSKCSCNLGMLPYYIKSLLESYGKGMDQAGVYAGELSHIEISPLVSIHAYFAYLFGGNIRKLSCQIRPYEIHKGETDRMVGQAVDLFTDAFLEGNKNSYLEAAKTVLDLFSRIEHVKTPRPKVAIFGDLYVRDNRVMNQDLIRFIEEAGGEVITTPFSEYMKIVSAAHFKRMLKQGHFLELLTFKSLFSAMEFLENRYLKDFNTPLEKNNGSRNRVKYPEADAILSAFNFRLEQGGESWENVLKIFHILEQYPDVSLFVQTNPAFCCPSLITEAMSRDIERLTGVPVVTLTYDGTGTPVNDRLVPYLKYPKRFNGAN